MDGDLLSQLLSQFAIYNPGSDLGYGFKPTQIIWGRTGNENLVGYQPVPAYPNPNAPQPQIDLLIGDFVVDDPAFRQWNDTFILGDWEAPYYANSGSNDYGLIFDFNPAQDFIQLYGSANDYQLADVGTGSTILFQTPTGPDVVGVVLGASNLSLGENYFQFRGTTPPPGPVAPQVQQLGSLGLELAPGVAVDPSGNVYIAGGTNGSIGGPNAGRRDAFFAKYDNQGNLLFTQQLGTSGYEEIFGLGTDNQGNFYVSGLTDSALGGPKQAEQYDAFVAKYDSNGNQQWIRQVGQNVQFPTFDLAVDPNTGDAFISGPNVKSSIEDPDNAYVIKFDTNGNQQWISEIGTSGLANFDESYGITVGNDGSVYATGWTNGDLGGPNQGLYDGWVAKYDNTTGAVQWVSQYGGSDYDWSWDVASDSQGNVYTTGFTLGNLGGQNAGSYDVYLTKFDSQGNQQWIQQFGTAEDDEARNLYIDTNNNIFLTGYTRGNLGGSNAGSFDAWVAKYDTSGNQQWITQFGTSDRDDGLNITSDNLGNLYVSGDTQGSLGAANAGSWDAYVAKLDAATGTLLDFSGGDGNDTGSGGEGNNNGGGGNDTLYGTASDDILNGGEGNNLIYADEGKNTVTAGSGNDEIYTGTSDDIINADGGNNLIFAGEGNNTITTGAGNDSIHGGAGNDSIYAGAGDDVIYAGKGDNIIYGGEGNNLIYAVDEGKNTVTASSGNDEIYTGTSDDIINADGGNNLIFAGEGNNTITTGAGNDSIHGGAGNDSIYAGAGDDVIYAGEGDNIIYGGTGNNTVYSGSGRDLFALTPSEGASTIVNFEVGKDLLGLTEGLTFDQLSISQGTNGNEFFTQIGIANSDDLLATLNWVQADTITSSSFTFA
jgi:Ca2+-binding RTX toxin-like protein